MRKILKRYWGYDDFRGIQRDIIDSVYSGHDTLGLMPTGGGKSITFQVPALAMEGVCIVITPLVALMKDQVYHLRRRGIIADTIHAGVPQKDTLRILDNCILGNTKLLYVSPERLASSLFQTKLRHMRVSFITVDEAHCISQWGYDFRPAYLQIATIRTIHPEVPVLALTATATPQVINDIQDKLKLPDTLRQETQEDRHFQVFRMSFERKNLSYEVRKVIFKDAELLSLLQQTKGSAIVYVRSRQRSRDIAKQLTLAGLNATYFNAGLEQEEKDKRQLDWHDGRVQIIVATNAFGMGIDKPDVRIVIHYDCPDSPEAYFQEAGRAGRDGKPARAILLYSKSDNRKLARRIDETFPPKDYIRQVYEHLAYYYQIAVGDGYDVTRAFVIEDFCQRFRHFPVSVYAALQILQRAGYLEFSDEQDNKARIRFLVERDDLYQLKNISEDEDRLIITLMRHYGGLFADYVFVDEHYLALQAGMTDSDTYLILKNLAQRHIISFIPQRQTPYLRYLQRRVDADDIQLPPEIYEQRREQYCQRINAIRNYVNTDDRCRSRMLLEYFGEKTDHDCGICDVCRDGNTDIYTAEQEEDTHRQLLTLLSDHQRHHITELLKLQLPSTLLNNTLRQLIEEETITQEDGFLFCKR